LLAALVSAALLVIPSEARDLGRGG